MSATPKEFRHNAKKPLMISTEDVNGQTPPAGLLDTSWRHTGNKKTYIIRMFVWLGASDEWGFLMSTENSNVPVVRPLSHLAGNRSDGSKRYQRLDAKA